MTTATEKTAIRTAKLVVGFTNQYYTLWTVTEPRKVENEFYFMFVISTQYQQNLSMDYNEAVAKAQEMATKRGYELEIDLSLRGEHGRYFETTIRKTSKIPAESFSEYAPMRGFRIATTPLEGYDYETKEGVLKNRVISACWLDYLLVAKKDAEKTYSFKDVRRAVYARQRLVQEGILVKYAHEVDGEKRRYCTAAYAKVLDAKKETATLADGYHFTAGKRLELEIKELRRVSFDSQFGTFYIVTYATKCGKLVYYKGSSPLVAMDEFTKVKGTPEHSTYKGVAQTSLKRISTK